MNSDSLPNNNQEFISNY